MKRSTLVLKTNKKETNIKFPIDFRILSQRTIVVGRFSLKGGDPAAPSDTATLLRLHPSHWYYLRQLPPLRVRPLTLGTPNSHGVTGGVYKTRERIHPDMLIRDY